MIVLFTFLALLLLVLRVMLPGLLLSTPTPGTGPRGDLLPRTGRALFAGVAANLLIPVAFVAGRWTVLFDWLWWIVFVANAARWRVQRRELVPADLRRWLAPILLVLAAATLVLLLPVRSEWCMGGWDPGFYRNNAVRIARDGCIDGPRFPFYSEVARENSAISPLARTQYGKGYTALADSLPLSSDGRIPLFFFHLTPIVGASLQRLGGADFLDRVNAFLAFGALFPFAALLSSLGLRGYRRALPLLFMAISPLWWYHQNIPTSEMLYLFLLLGGAADWLDSRDARRPPWGAWTACFLLVVNHLNAAVLVGAFLALATFLEVSAADDPLPRSARFLRSAGAVAALALGFLWDFNFANATIAKLAAEGPVIARVIHYSLAVAAAALLFSLLPPFPRLLLRAAAWPARAAGLLAAVLVPAVAVASLFGPARDWFYVVYGHCYPVGQMLWWLMRICPFHGVPALVLAGAGFAVLALHRDPRHRRTALLLLVLGAGFLAVLYNPGIKKLFPWALRRFYVITLPALAIAQAVPVAWAIDAFRRKAALPRRAASASVLAASLVAVVLTLPDTLAAARASDYPGLNRVLQTLCKYTVPGDILVVDNPAWMAPFILACDIPAVNGERLMDGGEDSLWRTPDPDVRADLHTVLRHYASLDNHRTLWLTTTSDGLSVYPEPPAVDPAPLVSVDFPATTVVQGQRNKYYATQTRTIPLRLYQGLP